MKLILAALVMVAGGAAAADYLVPRPRLRSDDTAMTLCGRNLAEAHALFCYEAGYTLKKRSSFPPLVNALARYETRGGGGASGENEVESEDAGWPWLSHHRAGAFGVGSRSKRGIVEECCYKPCTREELLTYC